MKPSDAKKTDAKVEKTTYMVEILDLRVMVTTDDGLWFAQAVEIDYAAQGSSLEAAKENFERGLAATIRENLRVYGDLDRMLEYPPADVLKELREAASCKHLRFSQVSFHEFPAFPFKSISYLEEERQAA